MSNLRLPLSHDYNLGAQAQLTDFCGWNMPVSYQGILDEYKECRENAVIFDVSHMGRILIEGKDALKFLDFHTTNKISKLKNMKAIYTLLLNEEAGIIDDLIIYKFNEAKLLVISNAANHDKVIANFNARKNNQEIKIIDLQEELLQIAVQGPSAKSIVNPLLDLGEDINYFNFEEIDFYGEKLIVAATGYTGEAGYELYASKAVLLDIWNELTSERGVQPAGLGARDLLRLEAGYCLHGNDIDKNSSPTEANLGWNLDTEKAFSIGLEKLTRKNKELKALIFPKTQKLIPRNGMELFQGGESIGKITSGAYSPILDRSIALAYLKTDLGDEEIMLKQRNKIFKAKVLQENWFYRNIKEKMIQE